MMERRIYNLITAMVAGKIYSGDMHWASDVKYRKPPKISWDYQPGVAFFERYFELCIKEEIDGLSGISATAHSGIRTGIKAPAE